MRLKRVDLPAALGPMTATISPVVIGGVETPETVSFLP